MFREMRRKKQALSHDEIIDLLKSETRGVLSVLGDDGYPYGIPMNHFYNEEDGKLYFHGNKTGHRVDAIIREPKVSYCVFGQDKKNDGDWAYYVKSVVIFGRAEIIEDYDETMRICELLCEKFPCPPDYLEREIAEAAKRTMCFSVTIEHMTGKLVHEA